MRRLWSISPCVIGTSYVPFWIRAGIQQPLPYLQQIVNGSPLLNSRLLRSVLLSRQVHFSVWVAEWLRPYTRTGNEGGAKVLTPPLLRHTCASILVDAGSYEVRYDMNRKVWMLLVQPWKRNARWHFPSKMCCHVYCTQIRYSFHILPILL